MRSVLIGLLGALICWQASQALAQKAPLLPGTRTISVEGHGQVKTQPDEVIITFLVQTRADSGDACARLQSETAGKVVDILKKKLGEKGEVETSQYSLSPTFEALTPAAAASPPVGSWHVLTRIDAITDRLETVGPLIEAGLRSGAARFVQAGFEGAFPPARPGSTPCPGESPCQEYQLALAGRGLPKVTFDVQVDEATVGDAVSKGVLLTRKIEQALKQQLGKEGQVWIESSQVSEIVPSVNTNAGGFAQRTRSSYVARTNVDAKSRQIDLLGPLVEVGMAAGASQVVSVSFTVVGDAAARKQAIAAASTDAQTKAESVAHSMGVKLGKILDISTEAEVQPETVQGQLIPSALGGSAPQRGRSSMPVLPRDVAFAANVNVIYQIE
jgi:uncharacterized protein YggE